MTFSKKAVDVVLGLTTNTCTPSFRSSIRSELLKPRRANLLAQYSLLKGTAQWPSTDPTFTMAGSLPRRSQGRRCPYQLHRRHEIDVHHGRQSQVGGTFEGADRTDASIVDEYIQRLPFHGNPIGQLDPCRRLRDVNRQDVATCPRRLQFVLQLPEFPLHDGRTRSTALPGSQIPGPSAAPIPPEAPVISTRRRCNGSISHRHVPVNPSRRLALRHLFPGISRNGISLCRAGMAVWANDDITVAQPPQMRP